MYSNTPCTHEPLSPTVQRCCDTRNRLLAVLPAQQPREEDFDNYDAADDAYTDAVNVAAKAFQIAMPEPTGRSAVKAFIACITHGIAVGIIDDQTVKCFLSAARCASSALGKPRSRKNKKPAAGEENPQGIATSPDGNPVQQSGALAA
jgi:hypothetical protein